MAIHRQTTVTKDQIDGWILMNKAQFQNSDPQNIRWVARQLTSYDFLHMETISLEDVADIMTQFGLPTTPYTLSFTIVEDIDDPDVSMSRMLKKGVTFVVDCLFYTINGVSYFDPLGDYTQNTGYKVDFPFSMGISTFPYTKEAVKVHVLQFASVSLNGSLDNTYPYLVKWMFDSYSNGQNLFSVAGQYSNVHDYVRYVVRTYGTTRLGIFRGWDDERGESKRATLSTDLDREINNTNQKVLRILNLVKPELNCTIAIKETHFEDATVEIFGERVQVAGSSFVYKTNILFYKYEGKEYCVLLMPADNSNPVHYLVQDS